MISSAEIVYVTKKLSRLVGAVLKKAVVYSGTLINLSYLL